MALDKIFASAKAIDQKAMTLQYFETLKNIGLGASTKFIFRWSSPACWPISSKGKKSKK